MARMQMTIIFFFVSQNKAPHISDFLFFGWFCFSISMSIFSPFVTTTPTFFLLSVCIVFVSFFVNVAVVYQVFFSLVSFPLSMKEMKVFLSLFEKNHFNHKDDSVQERIDTWCAGSRRKRSLGKGFNEKYALVSVLQKFNQIYFENWVYLNRTSWKFLIFIFLY